MDALTPLTASSGTATGPPTLPVDGTRVPGSAPSGVYGGSVPAGGAGGPGTGSLPPLPEAVQRHQLDPAPPTLMSREEMLNLLSLVV